MFSVICWFLLLGSTLAESPCGLVDSDVVFRYAQQSEMCLKSSVLMVLNRLSSKNTNSLTLLAKLFS
eukprot:m.198124 g.198124  ORF g.198124 m.198124 type:complete len:67 (-) comp15715_c0_seq3:3612-3812(-)